MARKHMKRCPYYLLPGKCPFPTGPEITSHLLGWLLSNTQIREQGLARMWTLAFSYVAVSDVKWCHCLETNVMVVQATVTTWHSNSRYSTVGNAMYVHKNLHTKVHSGIIVTGGNNPEVCQLWTHEHTLVYHTMEYDSAIKRHKAGTHATTRSRKCHADWKKPDTKYWSILGFRISEMLKMGNFTRQEVYYWFPGHRR